MQWTRDNTGGMVHPRQRASDRKRSVPPVTVAVRAATESGALAFALAALAVATLYRTLGSVMSIYVIAPSFALGSVACVTVFLSVLVSARSRFPGKTPVLGARRSAAIGIFTVVAVAVVHASFTFGSGGFLYSLLWQVVYACLIGGGPVAAVGALFGCSIERRYFGVRAPNHSLMLTDQSPRD